jgi:hypothetical protein
MIRAITTRMCFSIARRILLIADQNFTRTMKNVIHNPVDGEMTHGGKMLILGVILMLIGFLLGIPILWTIGVVLAIVGAVLWILGAAGREIGGRRHYY